MHPALEKIIRIGSYYIKDKEEPSMIKLGSKVKCIYTGFEGIAVARTEYLYGCARISVQATELNEGKPVAWQTFDEQQLVLVEEKKPEVSPDSSATTGGPHDAPKRNPDPK